MAYSPTLIGAIGALTVSILVVRLIQQSRVPLPPGPRGLPWFGNVFQWPVEKEWLTFTRWYHRYGDIVHVTLYGRSFIIINSARAAFEMLDKKGALYSDRAKRAMLELSDLDMDIPQAPYGDRHRKLRTMILKSLGTRATVTSFADVFDTHWNRFLRRVVESTDTSRHLLSFIRRSTGSIILHIDYGYEVMEGADPMLKAAEEMVLAAGALLAPRGWLVDAFPILKKIPAWFPGAGFQRIALYTKDKIAQLRELPHAWVRRQMEAGTAQPSFVVNHLCDPDLTPEKEGLLHWAADVMFAAGFDTTASSIYTFYLAMTLYPSVQQQAQAEISRVIGSDRLPTLRDWDSLPYVSAVVKEVLRWQPVTPQALPHCLKEDDIQDGYLIPKGSVIIPNVWNMLHDPEIYGKPMEFNPSRFLGDHPERDPTDFCFGFGRRICPGLMLAQASIFVACAKSLAAFNITTSKDADGVSIVPQQDFTSGIISFPKEFQCAITPRSDKAKTIATNIEFNGE